MHYKTVHNNPVTCDLCGHKSKSEMQHNDHIIRHHGAPGNPSSRRARLFKCKYCAEGSNPVFEKESQLRRHIHQGWKLMSCC